jgi:hypothetical protein
MMTRQIFVTSALVAVFLGMAVLVFNASRCNWQRFRTEWGRSPLHGMPGIDRLEPTIEPTTPRHWEGAPVLSSAQRAEAYALLAEDRRAGFTIGGELMILFAGGSLGSLLPLLKTEEWSRYALLLPITACALGVLLRYRAANTYAPLIDWYHQRALVLKEKKRPRSLRVRGRRGSTGF